MAAYSWQLLSTGGTTIKHLNNSWALSLVHFLLPDWRKCFLSSPKELNHMVESQVLCSKSILTFSEPSDPSSELCQGRSSVFTSPSVGHQDACVSRSHPSMVLGMAPHILVISLNPQFEMHSLVLITIPYLPYTLSCLWSVKLKIHFCTCM